VGSIFRKYEQTTTTGICSELMTKDSQSVLGTPQSVPGTSLVGRRMQWAQGRGMGPSEAKQQGERTTVQLMKEKLANLAEK